MTINDLPTEYFGLIGFVAFVLFVVLLQIWLAIKGRWRRWQLRRMAEQLEGTFVANPAVLPSADPEALQAMLPGLKMHKLHNLLIFEWAEVPFYLFDYTYKPNVRPYSTAEETVLVMDLDFNEVTPPQFIVRPRQQGDRLKERLGYTFVRIPDTHKLLRKKFSVLSFEEDHEEVVRLLGDVLPVLMEELDPERSRITTTGRFVVYTRHRKLMPAFRSHVDDYLTIGRYLLASVASQVGR